VAGASAFGLMSLRQRPSAERATIEAGEIAARAQTGDLIFRGTQSMEGNVVRWFDGKSDFTHVGMLVRSASESNWSVVHATPDTRQVTLERLETFTSTAHLTAAGLYRWQSVDPASIDLLQRDAISTVGRPFDGAYDASDVASLYCTELIWLLAQHRGWVGAPMLKTISTPLGRLRVITIDALLRDLPLTEVWHSGPAHDQVPTLG